MVVPAFGRDIAAGVGALRVVTAAASVIGTIIVPRPVDSWLTRGSTGSSTARTGSRPAGSRPTSGVTGCSPGRRRPSCSAS